MVHKPTRTLFITHCTDLYGAEMSLYTLIDNIDRDVCTPYLLAPGEGPLTKKVTDLGIPVFIRQLIHWVSFYKEFKSRSYLVRLFLTIRGLRSRVWAIAALIDRHDIDLVYTNTVTCIEGALAAHITNRPHIWHLRENIVGNSELRALLPQALISRIIRKFSDRVIANSKALEDSYFSGSMNSRITVVYNGLDLDDFARKPKLSLQVREELGISQDVKVVAIIGSIVPNKGHKTFIDAALSVCNDFESAVFIVLGEGDSLLKQNLIDIIEQAGFQERFMFLGWRQDIERILSATDLLLSTSVQEAFGRTIVEAMAASVPVVATRSGGPEEIVVEGETGFLVPVNDANATATAALRILKEPELASRFAKAGRQRAEDIFSLIAYVNNIESIINNVGHSSKGFSNEQRH